MCSITDRFLASTLAGPGTLRESSSWGIAHEETAMAKLVSFVGTTFATSQAETFVGNGGSDTVSYALVGTGVNIGDYTSGISVNLATGVGSLGWALGDTYVGVENLVGSQHSDVLIGNYQANILDGGG